MNQTESTALVGSGENSSAPVAGDVVLRQLRWRYATKVFDPTRRISAGDWNTLEDALLLTPSSFGLQPWKFVVVTRQETKEQLVEVSWNQRQVADASHLVVFAVRCNLGAEEIDRWIQHMAKVRGLSTEALTAYRDLMRGHLLSPEFDVDNWAARQLYIALGNFMTCAAMMGIDTCPLEGIQPERYDAILGLDTNVFQTRVAAAAGYRSGDDRYAALAKVRYAAGDVITQVD